MRQASLIGVLLLSACAPSIQSRTPAMVEVAGYDPGSMTELAQQHCATHGRNALLTSEYFQAGARFRVFRCLVPTQ
jgi:hypothetical protein